MDSGGARGEGATVPLGLVRHEHDSGGGLSSTRGRGGATGTDKDAVTEEGRRNQ